MWFVGGTIWGRLETRVTVFQFEIGGFGGYFDLVDGVCLCLSGYAEC